MNEERKDTVSLATSEKAELLDIASETLGAQSEEMSEEKLLEMLTKRVSVTALNPQVCAEFIKAVEVLEELEVEVAGKRSAILEKNQFIEDKLAFFQKSGMVNIDDAEREKSNTSVQQFVGILDQMMGEIVRDVAFYRSLTSSTPPEYVTVMKSDPIDDFTTYIKARLAIIKRYIKAVKRDLTVSFSRYCYGFEMQIKRIMYIEQVLSRAISEQANQKE